MSDQPAAPAAPPPAAPPAPENTLPLVPLPPGAIPEAFAKNADPNSPPPMRMMAARGMAPIPAKVLVPVMYQLMMDPEPKIAAAAHKSFRSLDDKLLAPAISEPLPMQILDAFCHTLTANFAMAEKVLLNKSTPDAGFVHMAEHAVDERIINVVVENQERLLRDHDIVRALKRNPRCLRSDLDRAVDFLVREGVFLEDVSEFEDSFLRLGKSDMLAALKKVKITDEHLTRSERQKAQELGVSAEEFVTGGAGVLTPEEQQAILDELEDGAGEVKQEEVKLFHELPIPIQIKRAMSGSHEDAIKGLGSRNRLVAVAGIRNPKINDDDVNKLSKVKTLHEEVVREIATNGEWTKSYQVKFNLIANPKTPISLVMRWLPLLRGSDLKGLAKSKQVPTQVSLQAKRLLDRAN
jgi:hypothetical protein